MRKMLASPAFVPRLAAGDIGVFDTATMIEVLYDPMNAPELQGFWLKFFPEQINFTTQKIMFDEIDNNEYRLAPFVAPNVQGRPMTAKGFHVKPKHVVDPTRAIPRRAGERILGELSLAQKFDLIVADNLRRERLMIENRWDWMACQAIVNGEVVVAGEDYPSVTVSFGRNAGLTETLSGGALWTASTATPMADLATKRTLSYKLSKAPVNTVIFGLEAFAAFVQSNHPDVQELLNTLRRGNESVFNASNISDGSPYQFQGRISGPGGVGLLDLWTYNNVYEGDDGVGVPYMSPKVVVGVGGAIRGKQCFGAIMDKRAALAPLSMFPKLWDEEDPSVTYTMTQSAPLMVPVVPDNTFKIQVVA